MLWDVPASVAGKTVEYGKMKIEARIQKIGKYDEDTNTYKITLLADAEYTDKLGLRDGDRVIITKDE